MNFDTALIIITKRKRIEDNEANRQSAPTEISLLINIFLCTYMHYLIREKTLKTKGAEDWKKLKEERETKKVEENRRMRM